MRPRDVARWTVSALHAVRSHALFLTVLLAGAVLRVLVQLGFQPVIWFLGDSAAYLRTALELRPVAERPSAGAVLWALVEPLHSLGAVAALHHVLGLAVTTGVYVVLLRQGVPRWAAALGALPLALDGLVLTLEQSLVAEPVFLALAVLAVGALMWSRGRPSVPAVALAGLAAGTSVVTRSVGLGLVIALCAVLVARRVGVVRVATAFIACSLPVVGYAAVYAHTFGPFAVSETTGLFLYGRLATIADCSRFTLPPEEEVLCPDVPVDQRLGPLYWTWDPQSPYYTELPTEPGEANRISLSWSLHVIREQPGDYADLVFTDLGRMLSPHREPGVLTFRPAYEPLPAFAAEPALEFQDGQPGDTVVDQDLEPFLADYQRAAMVPGTVYGLALVIGVLGVVFGRDPTGRGARSWTAMLVLTGAAVLAMPALLAGYDPRYLTPALPVLSMAGVLGGWSLWGRVRQRRVDQRQVDQQPGPVPSAEEEAPAVPGSA